MKNLPKQQLVAVFALFLVALGCQAFVSQGPVGEVIEETRDVSDFNSISVSSWMNVYISQGSSQKVEVHANEEFIEDIETKVVNGTLHVDFKGRWKNSWNGRDITAKVMVTVTSLDELESSGSSDVFFVTDYKGGDLEINSSGSSDVVAKNNSLVVGDLRLESSGSSDIVLKDILAQQVFANCSGSSDIELHGEGDSLEVDTDGSSDFAGKKFTVAKCIAESQGSSDIYIRVTDEFEGVASGSSDITYYGTPRVNHVSTRGSADINARN